ncbi:MAG: hypothetical protein V9G04_13300 [Nocardioides sp.]|jgi:acetyl esterase
MNRLERWQQRAEQRLVPKLLGLPVRVQRRLVGAPVVIEGQRLATETQLLLKLMALNPSPAAERLPMAQGRRLIDHQSALVGGDQPIGDVCS